MEKLDSLTKDQRYYRKHKKERRISVLKNREYYQEYFKKYRENHKEYFRRYYQENRTRYTSYKGNDNNKHKEWRAKNKERLRKYWRIQYHNRREQRKGAGKLTTKIIQLVYEDNIKQYGTLTCYLCLRPIEFGKDNLEHKIPLSRGGMNEYSNLAIACWRCNNKKRAKTEQEFKEEYGKRD